jgi:NADH-quinone oxidoreductase subunit M
MPIFSIFFLIFTLANIGLPGTVNFIGEFLVLVGV